jgi:hypothetical protein
MSRLEQRRFPKMFEDACRRSDILLDDSPHPRYTCDNHFIKIIIDESKQVTKIENHETELVTIPMDIAASHSFTRLMTIVLPHHIYVKILDYLPQKHLIQMPIQCFRIGIEGLFRWLEDGAGIQCRKITG